jgi:hypothetical protein
MFIFVIFFTFFFGLCDIITAQDGKGADARSTEVSVGCFSSDSSVMLTNGEQKQIGYLRTGDEIISIKDLKIVSSEMFIMLDKEISKQGILFDMNSFIFNQFICFFFSARFYRFNTISGHEISLTGLHLIPIVYSNNTIDYIPAREVKLGDRFYVLMNNQLESSSVINITIELKKGYFAPLTLTGR